MGKRHNRPNPGAKQQSPALKATRAEAAERQAAASKNSKAREAAPVAAPSDSGSLGSDEEFSDEDFDEDDEEDDSFDFDALSPEQQKALLASLEEEEEGEEGDDDEEVSMEEGDEEFDDEEDGESEGGASEDDFDGMGVGSGDDDSDMEDDDEEKKEVAIDWDAREMFTRHVDAVSCFIDSAIPDGENLVDRHDFGNCLRRSIASTVVTVVEQEEDDASDVSVDTSAVIDDENTYGVFAFVPVSGFAKRFESCAGLLKLLSKPPEHTLETGTPAVRLLKSNSDAAPARALLFVNDHLNVIPPSVVAQVHEGIAQELTDALASKKHEGFPIAPASHVVMLARVQRSKGEGMGSAQTLKSGDFDLGQHDFLRWEDEVYFRRRDKRIATVVHKFPRYVEDQEEQDIPRCVVFALELDAFRTAVSKLGALAVAMMSR
eukprot:CAMPEP_0174828716 /NCGR_PEP_ID=MMETSP1114-20130205/1496_1 /TAXON_ID=312471 /ORGANISM="Neobodo designis, Strain CCAP 1951/1" /LENGTH=432 /DNA_ID=CAMNT_0016062441 /DNA_START=33 /DNA_END=1327 /DNA_ORIENTATION=+